MDSKGMAENIATRMKEDQEYITALKAVLGRELNPARLAALERKVQDEIAHVRSGPPYRESAAQFQRELDDAKEDSALISVLYSWGLGRSNVGSD